MLFPALALALAVALAAPRAHAQTVAELDALVGDSADTESGIALAQRQIAAGELTIATATLERVLMADPRSDAALLLHASLLCRLDDAGGARTELSAPYIPPRSNPGWADVNAACGAMPTRSRP